MILVEHIYRVQISKSTSSTLEPLQENYVNALSLTPRVNIRVISMTGGNLQIGHIAESCWAYYLWGLGTSLYRMLLVKSAALCVVCSCDAQQKIEISPKTFKYGTTPLLIEKVFL